jgi:GPI ethanolamine phosphate transferase 1
MSEYNVGRLLTVGLVFHCVFILSVFDTYFTSPVVRGMASHHLGEPEAKRLVFIVGTHLFSQFTLTSHSTGDGLRADLLFSVNAFPSIPDAPAVVAPYLRSIIQSRGAFGVSHTHVPTESRPGHVALIGMVCTQILMSTHEIDSDIGGMYEDVSAVTKVSTLALALLVSLTIACIGMENKSGRCV